MNNDFHAYAPHRASARPGQAGHVPRAPLGIIVENEMIYTYLKIFCKVPYRILLSCIFA